MSGDSSTVISVADEHCPTCGHCPTECAERAAWRAARVATHWADCWRVHLDCAGLQIGQLRAALYKIAAEDAEVAAQGGLHQSFPPCGHRDDDPQGATASPGELSHLDAEGLEDQAGGTTPDAYDAYCPHGEPWNDKDLSSDAGDEYG